MNRTFQPRNQFGFSLLEILVAMAIMAILSGVMVLQFMDSTKEAMYQRLKGDFAVIDSALLQYQFNSFLLPSMEQGLPALVSKPDSSPIPRNYPKRGYLKKLNLDPWGNEYQYKYPGEFGKYDVYSLGADGEVGGDELGVDVGSWNIDAIVVSLKDQK